MNAPRGSSAGRIAKAVAGALAAAALTIAGIVGAFRFVPFDFPLSLPFVFALGVAVACWRSRRVPNYVAAGIVTGVVVFTAFVLWILSELGAEPI